MNVSRRRLAYRVPLRVLRQVRHTTGAPTLTVKGWFHWGPYVMQVEPWNVVHVHVNGDRIATIQQGPHRSHCDHPVPSGMADIEITGFNPRELQVLRLYETRVALTTGEMYVIAFVPPLAGLARRRPHLESLWVEYVVTPNDYPAYRRWVPIRPHVQPHMIRAVVDVPKHAAIVSVDQGRRRRRR